MNNVMIKKLMAFSIVASLGAGGFSAAASETPEIDAYTLECEYETQMPAGENLVRYFEIELIGIDNRTSGEGYLLAFVEEETYNIQTRETVEYSEYPIHAGSIQYNATTHTYSTSSGLTLSFLADPFAVPSDEDGDDAWYEFEGIVTLADGTQYPIECDGTRGIDF